MNQPETVTESLQTILDAVRLHAEYNAPPMPRCFCDTEVVESTCDPEVCEACQ